MPDPGFPLHFLRPWWLLALVPATLMLLLILRRGRPEQRWATVIDPHLLRHLLVTPAGHWQLRPVWLVTAGLLLAILALAGPAWQRELPPFVADKAPLMIALDASSSMGRDDVAPTRLERAKQKIRDLLATRGTARTGLIAYAGSAHLVMPPTDDRSVTEPFLAALSPGLMPTEGKRVAAAIALAADALANERVPGTILVVADDLGDADAAAIQQAASGNGVVMLRIAPPGETDRDALRTQSVSVTVDDGDIRSLERRIETRFEAAQAEQAGARWRDDGYWLLLPVALIALLWFRRGTTVQWMLVIVLLDAMPARAEPRFVDLWVTPDQQGRIAFDRGDYAEAARRFADPMWRGIAAYRALDYLAAAEAFRKIDTPAGHFALGNAEANNHAWEKAIAAYEKVLAAQPNHQGARTNLAVVRAALEAAEAKRRDEEQGQSPPSLRPDEVKVDPKQKGGERAVVQAEDLTTPGSAEAWMREVQTSPADFLKLKFAIQAAQPREPGK